MIQGTSYQQLEILRVENGFILTINDPKVNGKAMKKVANSIEMAMSSGDAAQLPKIFSTMMGSVDPLQKQLEVYTFKTKEELMRFLDKEWSPDK